MHCLTTSLLTRYSFSDITWGTKGDNKISTDLGVAKTDSKTNAVEIDAPTEQTDIDAAYDAALQTLHSKPTLASHPLMARALDISYVRPGWSACSICRCPTCGRRTCPDASSPGLVRGRDGGLQRDGWLASCAVVVPLQCVCMPLLSLILCDDQTRSEYSFTNAT